MLAANHVTDGVTKSGHLHYNIACRSCRAVLWSCGDKPQRWNTTPVNRVPDHSRHTSLLSIVRGRLAAVLFVSVVGELMFRLICLTSF